MTILETYSIRTLTRIRDKYEPRTEEYIKLTALIRLARLRQRYGTSYYMEMRNHPSFVKLLGQRLDPDHPELQV